MWNERGLELFIVESLQQLFAEVVPAANTSYQGVQHAQGCGFMRAVASSARSIPGGSALVVDSMYERHRRMLEVIPLRRQYQASRTPMLR